MARLSWPERPFRALIFSLATAESLSTHSVSSAVSARVIPALSRSSSECSARYDSICSRDTSGPGGAGIFFVFFVVAVTLFDFFFFDGILLAPSLVLLLLIRLRIHGVKDKGTFVWFAQKSDFEISSSFCLSN